MTKIYTTTASVVGARNGTAKLSDNDTTFTLSVPGSQKSGYNPEQFFAMGYGACFDGALGLVKKLEGVSFDDELQITIDLNKEGDTNFYLTAAIHVVATNTDIDAQTLQNLVEKAHQLCPYSKAVAGNLEVALTSEVK